MSVGQAEKIISRVILEMARKNGEGKIGTEDEITERIHNRKKAGEDTSAITLQLVPGGRYSPEVHDFLSRLHIVGHVEWRPDGGTTYFIPLSDAEKKLREFSS